MATAYNKPIQNSRETTVSSVSINPLASSLRRTTCDVCRERKVRCDRTKPECLRCKRFGSVCTYSALDTDAARIQKALNSLSKRLEEAESRLQSQPHAVQCLSPPSQGPVPDSNAAKAPSFNYSTTNSEGYDWDYGNRPMVDFGLPDGMIFSHDFPTAIPPDNTPATIPIAEESSFTHQIGHEPITTTTADNAASLLDSRLGSYAISVEDCERMSERYFAVVQRHLPLVKKEAFFRNLQRSPEKHQILALKYAICMSGAEGTLPDIYIKERCYSAARHHLEEAELGSDKSSFWSIEAAQALVLVARFEVEHFTSARALITMSRLLALVSVLTQEVSELEMGNNLDEEELSQRRVVSLISFSIQFQQICLAESTCWSPTQEHSSSSITDGIDYERLKINLLTNSRPISEDEPFGVLCVALRIAVDAKHHERRTAAILGGIEVPSFNFCRDHECIESRIGAIVTKWLESSSPSPLSSTPNCEVRVLAVLVALGTRIQLFKTALRHSNKSKFFGVLAHECRQESVASAFDMCDLLRLAEVRRSDNISIYREARFYLMPALFLAAEALIAAIEARGQETTRGILHRHVEIRQRANTILDIMDACNNEAGSYTDSIARFRASLDTSDDKPILHTAFSASRYS
ncbi:hypothetical protein GGR57DRAFT_107791 [Xylariaceae sp. FL1272]|nr:hypothetical protein GGR57DRAFT_107791 [Xylariaceae sp. FL1272]